VYFGEASFAGPSSVALNGQTIHFKKALIATGRGHCPVYSRPGGSRYLTNENVFDLTQLPPRLLVIGGVRWAANWRRHFPDWVQVTIVQDEPMFLLQRNATPRRFFPTP